jgi:hypothetical protein
MCCFKVGLYLDMEFGMDLGAHAAVWCSDIELKLHKTYDMIPMRLEWVNLNFLGLPCQVWMKGLGMTMFSLMGVGDETSRT